MSGPLDVDKIGYRWKGAYSASVTYIEGDVVRLNGGAYVYRGGAFVPFALGQQDATTKGHILTGGAPAVGVVGQSLFMNSGGAVEFRYNGDRNGTVAVGLLQTISEDGPKHQGSIDYMGAIMTDGSVRMWGRTLNGCSGLSNQDVTRIHPGRVPFPPGTPPIIKMTSAKSQTYFVDSGGGLWYCGSNTGNYMSGYGATGVVPIPVKINGNNIAGGNQILSTTKIVDVSAGKDYIDNFHVMAKDDLGRVYSWGYNLYGGLGLNSTANVNFATLVPFTASTPIKTMCLSGGTYCASALIDFSGVAYYAGPAAFVNAGPGGTILVHQKVNTRGQSVKKINFSATDHHAEAGVQAYWATVIICDNGNAYMVMDGTQTEAAITWGNFAANPLDWNNPFHTNVDDLYVIHGGYPRALALLKNGTVQHRGYAGYNIDGVNGTNRTTWFTVPGLTNIAKLRVMGGEYATTAFALTTTGLLYIWGRATTGCRGVGDALATDSVTTGVSPVLLPGRIIDFQTAGYSWASSFILTVFALTSKGEVYAWGSAVYGLVGDDDNDPISTPSHIRF